jgi:molybdate transport repressor ModE-like protein
VARIEQDVVGQLEQARDGAVELVCRRLGPSVGVQVGTADVSHEQRVAAEDEPGVVRSTAAVGDHVRVVRGGMPGRGKRSYDGVSQLDHGVVAEGSVLEGDVAACREVSSRAVLDERRQAGHVVRLQVRLEDGRDGSAETLRLLEVRLDELGMGVDDGERTVRKTPEEVAGAGGRFVEEGAQDHRLVSTLGRSVLWDKTNLPIRAIDVTDTSLSLLWDSTRLRLLVEVERHGTVSAAARAVGIGQPTASEHLRLLEAAAGQRLVERNGRGSRLTEAGSVLAARAREALSSLRAGEEELGALAGLEAGTIHVGASTTPGVYLLPGTLGCFRRDHPNVDVEVEIASTGEVIGRLLAGRVQVALVGETEVDDRIELTPFLADEIVGIAKPGALTIRVGRVKANALADETLLVREATSSTRQTADKALAAAGVRPRRVWELDSNEALKRAAREGLGVAFLSRYAVAEEVHRGELESFRLAGRPRIERRLFIARIARRPATPSEQGFVATLLRCCSKSAEFAAACVAQGEADSPVRG